MRVLWRMGTSHAAWYDHFWTSQFERLIMMIERVGLSCRMAWPCVRLKFLWMPHDMQLGRLWHGPCAASFCEDVHFEREGLHAHRFVYALVLHHLDISPLHIFIYRHIHTYIHTYIHACMHTYIHTYIHL